jgi:hypothetical protein
VKQSDLGEYEDNAREKQIYNMIQKEQDFSMKPNTIVLNPWRLPPSLPHLIIGIKTRSLAHFYSRHYENKNGKWQ